MTTTSTIRLEIPWRKGCYLARLDGEDPKYGLHRDFERGVPVKSVGVLVFDVTPGWYEAVDGYNKPRRYLAVDELHAVLISSESAIARLAVISAGPVPGAPGAWAGDRCRCGAEVSDFDGVGFPWCDEHLPKTSTAQQSDETPF